MTTPLETAGRRAGTFTRGGHHRWARLKGLFGPFAFWMVLVLVGCAVGYALVEESPLVVGLMAALLMLLVASRTPWPLALFALAFSPLGTMIVVKTVSVDFRFTLMSWWLPAAGVFALWLSGVRKIVISKGTLALIVYAVYLNLTALWAPRPMDSVREGFQFFTFVWIFLVLDNVVRTPRQLEVAALAFLAGLSMLVAGSAFSKLVTPILPAVRVLPTGASLTFVREYYHSVTIAASAGSILLVTGALLLGGRFSTARRGCLSVALIAAVLLHAIVLKRLESVGLLVGGLLVFSFYGWRRTALYAVAGALLVVTISLAFPDIRAHYETATDVEDNPWHYALPIAGFILWEQSPILGHGIGSYSYMAAPVLARMKMVQVPISSDEIKAPHNLVAKILSEQGVVGLVVFAVFAGTVLWGAWRGARMRGVRLPNTQALCRGMLGASLVQLTVSLGENVDNAAIFWIILAMGYRAAQMLRESQSSIGAEAEHPRLRRYRAGPGRLQSPRVGVPG